VGENEYAIPTQRRPGHSVRILGIPGSVREESLNAALLRFAGELLPPDAELGVIEGPELASLPGFDPSLPSPEPVERLRRAVAEADALLLATPEYNGSIPGALKNAIDWAASPPREGPIRGKPAAVVGADRGEIGADWAHADARKVLESAGARVVREGLSIRYSEAAFDSSDRLVRPGDAERLGAVVEELVSEAELP
jgi:chromate reductase